MAVSGTTAAFRAASALARTLPQSVAHAGGRALARGVVLASDDRRRLVARNLQRAHDRPLDTAELAHLVNETFENYARYYVQSFRLPAMSAAQIDAGFSYEGFGLFEDALERGTGPIVALPHLGGWEWAAFWLALVPRMRVTAVVEPLQPPDLFEWFVQFRRSLGMQVVPLGPSAGAAVLQAVKDGHVTCLVADRDLTGEGVPVDFFGERTTLPAGPAALALRTGAPIVPTVVYFRGGGVHAVCGPQLDTERRGRMRDDVARVTQDLAHAFEEQVRRAPAQWHLMQPNWPSDYDLLGRPRPPHLVDL